LLPIEPQQILAIQNLCDAVPDNIILNIFCKAVSMAYAAPLSKVPAAAAEEK
jgi:hypothetical protein